MARKGKKRAGGEDWNGKREQAALALARGLSVVAAAAEVGIGERTLHRWRNRPAFAARVRQLRSEIFGTVTGRLTDLAAKAADRLEKLIASTNEPVAIAAVKTVFDIGLKLHEIEIVEHGIKPILDEIERAKAGKKAEAMPADWNPPPPTAPADMRTRPMSCTNMPDDEIDIDGVNIEALMSLLNEEQRRDMVLLAAKTLARMIEDPATTPADRKRALDIFRRHGIQYPAV